VYVLDRPVEMAREVEVTGRGAAMLAARAIGAASEGLAADMERIEPEPGAVETHRNKYERWRQLGRALDALREG
jgi:sugar (pentulose or hexulose) kinase